MSRRVRASPAEILVATRVISVPVGVENEVDRPFGELSHGGGDLLGQRSVFIVDHERGVGPRTGGTVAGMIRSADRVLALIDDETRLIPGHGPLSNRTELREFRDMLAGIHEVVSALVTAGRSREEVIAAKPTAEWDEVWAKGFLTPDIFAGIADASVRAEDE